MKVSKPKIKILPFSRSGEPTPHFQTLMMNLGSKVGRLGMGFPLSEGYIWLKLGRGIILV
jgi:hypothetical protein